MSPAEEFAATLREEALRRTDDRYVHHAIIRTQMRDMADTIERWERADFRPGEAAAAVQRVAAYAEAVPTLYDEKDPMPDGLSIDVATDWAHQSYEEYRSVPTHPHHDLTYADLCAVVALAARAVTPEGSR